MNRPIAHTPSSTARVLLPVAAVLLAAACSVQGTPTASPTATAAEPTPSATAPTTATASPTASPSPTASASPVTSGCDPTTLAARITEWTGAAGHRIAAVTLTNAGAGSCTVPALWQPQLVDGAGNVLIDGAVAAPSVALTMTPGGVLSTLVQDSNYCGPDALTPVSVAFVLPGGAGRIVATPLSPSDTSGVPPCLGPGSPSSIEMQPWA